MKTPKRPQKPQKKPENGNPSENLWLAVDLIPMKTGVVNGTALSPVTHNPYLLSLCPAIMIFGGKVELFSISQRN